ncbi:MalY/PatB family protein [Peribacillus sp. SCS-37]|uniref:MalY/PatB family protein n=1 Tax=Paraperibacillus esterisolvens TaxID=3115296 RepID=UPI003906D504
MPNSTLDEVIQRTNTSCLKWDLAEERFGARELLPMWVADMDFTSPQVVIDALEERVKHGIFGYTSPQASLYNAITGWMRKTHDWEIEKPWIQFSAGVVSALQIAIEAYTEPGDTVLVQSPVYAPFFNVVVKNGRKLANNQLVLDNGSYYIDFDDFEEHLKSGVKLFLFCSPHNPGGRIWTREELEKIGNLCREYEVKIISDEIHADLSLGRQKHIPLAGVSPEISSITITAMAPSKTFNIAGLQASVVIAENEALRRGFSSIQERRGFDGLNALALTAMEAAYRDGAPWLDAILDYIKENTDRAISFIEHEIPGLTCMRPDASFLLWIDARSLGASDQLIQQRLIEKGKLALDPGTKFGPGGEGFLRMNIGCPRPLLEEGLQRLKSALV